MAADKVAIIGGGWAGIACAMELAEHKVAVSLYESARQLGGRARRVDWNGIAIDNGQHLMIGAYRETVRLMQRLGTENLLERRPLELLMPGFRLRLPKLPKPMHLGIGLLTAQGLSLSDKLAAIRFMRHLQACHFRIIADLSVSTFLAEQQQPTNLNDKLWVPLCLAALNTPPEQSSAQVFCNVLRDSLSGARSDSDLLLNRADLGRLLPDTAADWLRQQGCDIHLASKVDQVHHDALGFHLSGHAQIAHQVVLAPHPARLPALLAGLLPDAPQLAGIAQQISEFTWQPVLTLWLRFAAPLAFPSPLLSLGIGQVPWAFERNDIAPGVVALVTSADGPHLQLPAEQLRDDYLALLTRQFGPLPTLLDWKTIIEKRATYTCAPNMSRPGNRTPLPGLYLAGDYTASSDPTQTYPATLEGAVRSGVECARMILADRT